LCLFVLLHGEAGGLLLVALAEKACNPDRIGAGGSLVNPRLQLIRLRLSRRNARLKDL
jgi:hypothetical protein